MAGTDQENLLTNNGFLPAKAGMINSLLKLHERYGKEVRKSKSGEPWSADDRQSFVILYGIISEIIRHSDQVFPTWPIKYVCPAPSLGQDRNLVGLPVANGLTGLSRLLLHLL